MKNVDKIWHFLIEFHLWHETVYLRLVRQSPAVYIFEARSPVSRRVQIFIVRGFAKVSGLF